MATVLKHLIIEIDKTITAAGRSLGIPRVTLSRILNAKLVPSANVKAKLEAAYGEPWAVLSMDISKET